MSRTPKTPGTLAELMGLGPAPTEAQIRARFRELVLPLHPDHNPDAPGAVSKFHALVKLREALLTQTRLAAAARASREHRRAAKKQPAAPPLVPREHKVIVPLDLDFDEAARGIAVSFRLPNARSASVAVPIGSTHGTLIEQAVELSAGRPQPVVFEVRVAPHARYRHDGTHLIVRVPWSDHQVMHGDVLRVETPYEHATLSVNRYHQRGESIRVPGKGLHSNDGRGDLYVELADRDAALSGRPGRIGGD
jgi:DnaJ-class molecular chaperone